MAKSRFLLPLVGLLLVPLAIAGLLTWSLGKPEDRLKDVKAAVVNEDEPIEINGQLTPLGRQLSAKLVEFTMEKLVFFLEFTYPNNGSGQRSHLFGREGKRDLELSHCSLQLELY